MATMLSQAECDEKRAQRCIAPLRRREHDVFFDRAPRQEARLLENDAGFAVRRQPHAAFENTVQTDDNTQQKLQRRRP